MWALTAYATWSLTGISNSHPGWVVWVTGKLRCLGIWEFLNKNHPEGEHLNLSNSLSQPDCFSSSQSDRSQTQRILIPWGRFLPSSYRWAQSQMLQTVIHFRAFSSLFEQSWRCKTLKSRRTERISGTQERQLVLKIKRLLIEEKTYKHKVQRKWFSLDFGWPCHGVGLRTRSQWAL